MKSPSLINFYIDFWPRNLALCLQIRCIGRFQAPIWFWSARSSLADYCASRLQWAPTCAAICSPRESYLRLCGMGTLKCMAIRNEPLFSSRRWRLELHSAGRFSSIWAKAKCNVQIAQWISSPIAWSTPVSVWSKQKYVGIFGTNRLHRTCILQKPFHADGIFATEIVYNLCWSLSIITPQCWLIVYFFRLSLNCTYYAISCF